jgi:hypothetical protein
VDAAEAADLDGSKATSSSQEGESKRAEDAPKAKGPAPKKGNSGGEPIAEPAVSNGSLLASATVTTLSAPHTVTLHRYLDAKDFSGA